MHNTKEAGEHIAFPLLLCYKNYGLFTAIMQQLIPHPFMVALFVLKELNFRVYAISDFCVII